jgi:hypothetical protein
MSSRGSLLGVRDKHSVPLPVTFSEKHGERFGIKGELKPNLLDPVSDRAIVLVVVASQGELDRLENGRLADQVVLNENDVYARCKSLIVLDRDWRMSRQSLCTPEEQAPHLQGGNWSGRSRVGVLQLLGDCTNLL